MPTIFPSWFLLNFQFRIGLSVSEMSRLQPASGLKLQWGCEFHFLIILTKMYLHSLLLIPILSHYLTDRQLDLSPFSYNVVKGVFF